MCRGHSLTIHAPKQADDTGASGKIMKALQVPLDLALAAHYLSYTWFLERESSSRVDLCVAVADSLGNISGHVDVGSASVPHFHAYA